MSEMFFFETHCSMSVRTLVRLLAHSSNFVKNNCFLPVILEKWTAGRECQNALFMM